MYGDKKLWVCCISSETKESALTGTDLMWFFFFKERRPATSCWKGWVDWRDDNMKNECK